MRRHHGWAVLLVAVACGEQPPPPIPEVVEQEDAPGLLAVETCRSLFDCACPDPPYDGREACRTQLEQLGNDRIMVAAQAGLTYDGACVSMLAGTRRELGCDVVPDAPTCIACKPYHGDRQAGEACTPIGVTVGLDDCAQGLQCVDAVCVPLCDALPELEQGQQCMAGIDVLGVCVESLYCETDSQTCRPAPQLGEACPDRACVSEAWCDPAEDYTCQLKREPTAQCFVDESCQSGRCVEQKCADVTASACALP